MESGMESGVETGVEFGVESRVKSGGLWGSGGWSGEVWEVWMRSGSVRAESGGGFTWVQMVLSGLFSVV